MSQTRSPRPHAFTLFSTLALTLHATACSPPPPDIQDPEPAPPVVGQEEGVSPNTLIVRMRAVEEATGAAWTISQPSSLGDDIPIESMEALDPAEATIGYSNDGGRHGGEPRGGATFRIELGPSLTPEEAAAVAMQREDVVFAEPDLVMHTTYLPDDEYFVEDQMYGLDRMDAESAWDIAERRGEGIIVAVIDTGVDLQHPDLRNQLWVNTDEIPGNGIDDDENGFVDDVEGWNFVNNNNTPQDVHGHGSHVAGTIAAEGNNQAGIIGVAFNATIMALKGLSDTGSGSSFGLAKAIRYAVDNGAHIINNSWGSQGRTRTVEEAIEYAHSRDVIVVNAAGNDNRPACGFAPAHVDFGITVAASNSQDQRSYFSNFGVDLDVAAPGGGRSARGDNRPGGYRVVSTVPETAIRFRPFESEIDGATYGAANGTSMATPHVAGLAALIRSVHPSWRVEQVRQAIRQSADPVAGAGFQTSVGFGRANALRAVQAGSPPPMANLLTPDSCGSALEDVRVSGIILSAANEAADFELAIAAGPEFGDSNSGLSGFETLASGNRIQRGGVFHEFSTLQMADGAYTLRLRVTDPESGLVSEDYARFNVDNIDFHGPFVGSLLGPNTEVAIGGRAPESSTIELAVAEENEAGEVISEWYALSRTGAKSGVLGHWTTPASGRFRIRMIVRTADFVHQEEVGNLNVDPRILEGFPARVGRANSNPPQPLDIDGDGADEIWLAGTVIRGDGSRDTRFADVFQFAGGVWDRDTWSALSVASAAAAADIDADGSLEVFGVEPSEAHGHILAARSSEGELLWFHPVLTHSRRNTWFSRKTPAPSIGDVDGDGELEVVSTLSGSRRTIVTYDAATGREETRFEAGIFRNGSAIALADLDGVPGDELVLSNGTLAVLKPDGQMLPGWPIEDAGNGEPSIADLDQDGQLDVLCSGRAFHTDGQPLLGWDHRWNSNTVTSGGVINEAGDFVLAAVESGLGADGYDSRINTLFRIFDASGETQRFGNAAFGEDRIWGTPGGSWPVMQSALIANVDADGEAEVLGYGRPYRNESSAERGVIYAISPTTGETRAQFEIVGRSSLFGFRQAAVADVNGDGLREVLFAEKVTSGEVALYAWRTAASHDSLAPWPMFQQNVRHTGVLDRSAPVIDPEDPTDPSDPEDPMDPSDPEDPVDPSDPEDPVDPSDPEEPMDPEEPACGSLGEACCEGSCDEGACSQGICRVFGGAFVRSEGRCEVDNPATHACLCEPGFVATELGPYDREAESIFRGLLQSLVICEAPTRPEGSFGGAYLEGNSAACTGLCEATAHAEGCGCPEGTLPQSFGVGAREPRSICAMNLVFCAPAALEDSGFGGAYLEFDERDSVSTSCRNEYEDRQCIPNASSEGCACPEGFSPLNTRARGQQGSSIWTICDSTLAICMPD